MAIYTTTVNELIENGFDFGLTDYPIFDESYRDVLNQKILGHYRYEYEIAYETAALWRYHLNIKLGEIMPYYNQLYKSEQLKIEPLLNYSHDVTKTITKSGTDTTKDSGTNTTTHSGTDTIESQTNSTDNTRNLNSDTPEGIINITSIDNANYATDYQLGDANNHQEGNSTNTKNLTDSEEIDTQHQRTLNLTDKHTEQTTGFYNVSQSKLLEDYRKTFLNIDLMIIEELRDLFLVIW